MWMNINSRLVTKAQYSCKTHLLLLIV